MSLIFRKQSKNYRISHHKVNAWNEHERKIWYDWSYTHEQKSIFITSAVIYNCQSDGENLQDALTFTGRNI